MKVVLFCGGMGLRMSDGSVSIPKPMVTIGTRPILWHIMKYYAHFGHKEFILCLGHRAEAIKEFFLTYSEAMSNDFVLSEGGRKLDLLQSDIDDWHITFVDTGLHNSIGGRLLAIKPHLAGEQRFLASYGDGLTDAPLPAVISWHRKHEKIATFMCVRPKNYSFHTVDLGAKGVVAGIHDITQADIWINGGFFVLENAIFDHLLVGEDLIDGAIGRLIDQEQVLGYRYEGFWAPMDTLKDKHNLEAMHQGGESPWQVWESNGHLDP